jgi:hypothetical protein
MIHEYLQISSDEPRSGRIFLRYGQYVFLPVFLIFLLLVTLNYCRNPYFLFGGDDTRARYVDIRDEYFIKLRLIEKIKPKTVIIGTSKADRGIDVSFSALTQPAFNFGLPGSTIVMHRATLEHTINLAHPEKIYLMLDFLAFNSHVDMNQRRDPVYEQYAKSLLLDTGYASRVRYRTMQILDTAWALVSSKATASSLQLSAYQEMPNRMKFDGSWVFNEEVAALPRFEFLLILHEFIGKELSPPGRPGLEFVDATSKNTLQEYETMLDFAYQHNTEISLVINPVHSISQLALYEAGLWEIQERWMRELVRINDAAALRHHKVPFPLWDFSAPAGYNSEALPAPGKRMTWHFEGVHYTPALGNIMLADIQGDSSAGQKIDHQEFGDIISANNVEERLGELRCALDSYRNSHPRELREVMNILRKFNLPTTHLRQPLDCARNNHAL